jgi:hypothetical protein
MRLLQRTPHDFYIFARLSREFFYRSQQIRVGGWIRGSEPFALLTSSRVDFAFARSTS